MRNRGRTYFLAVAILAILLVMALSGCGSLESFLRNPDYIYENGAVLVGGNDKPIKLVNNPQAVDVTYDEVLNFIRQDLTDQLPYIAPDSDSGTEPFVCSDFAAAVHNNAESTGIRAAYLGIDFADGGIGHAIDAFQTTDKGLVYIDCTGPSIYSQLEDNGNLQSSGSWDKVAYIEVGKNYGVVGLGRAQSPQYSFYEQYETEWQEYKDRLAAYNLEVKQFNQEIAGKVYRQGSAELSQIKTREAQLAEQEKSLSILRQEVGDSFFKPLGIIKSTFIHW